MDIQGSDRAFEFEIFDKAGGRIADISHIVQNRVFNFKLNATETLVFSMDMDVFNQYCQSVGSQPRTILWPNQVDIRVKFQGVYRWGFEVAAVTPYLNSTGTTLSVRCVGFLDLFSRRYITKDYAGVESTSIASDMITTTQAQTNGTFFVTIGAEQFVTGVLRDRTYERKNIKDALVALTRLETGTFDFRFTHDKKFETYEKLGSLRLDTPLTYGQGGNIRKADVPTEGSSVINKVLALGSGFGADQLTSTQQDTTSQILYGLREQIVQFNSVTEQVTLDQNALGHLGNVKDMLQIPVVTVTTNEIDLSVASVGDRLPVNLTQFDYTSNVNGLYRIEAMQITLDDNDFGEIVLSFDDLGVDQDESA